VGKDRHPAIKQGKYSGSGSVAKQQVCNEQFYQTTLKVRRGASVAYKAGARKMAEAYYNILTKGVAYVEQGR